MDIELTPVQAPEVVAAIVAVVASAVPPPPTPDPWWQAGIDDALET